MLSFTVLLVNPTKMETRDVCIVGFGIAIGMFIQRKITSSSTHASSRSRRRTNSAVALAAKVEGYQLADVVAGEYSKRRCEQM